MVHSVNRRGFVGIAAGLVASAGLAPRAAAADNPPTPLPANFAFAHPGILHSSADLDRMRTAVAAKTDPIWSGFQVLAADPRSSYAYVAHNTGQITTWGRGPYNYQEETPNDAAAAYQNALMWAITGDVRHADTARDILDIWAETLECITGADGPLGAALQGFKFANAAEILWHSGYFGWNDAGFRRCQDSLRGVWYRAQSGFALYANGNWDAGAMRTIAAIAVLCDDRVLFEDAMRYAAHGAGDGSVTHRIIDAAGQGQESGRDQTHEQLALGLLADGAQVAWNQGVDLYGFAADRILASYEYDAEYNLGNDDVPFVPALDRSGKYIRTVISTSVRGVNRPIYELAYGHYVSTMDLAAPCTTQAVFRGPGGVRFIEGYNEDHPGFGTLAYARSAPTSRVPAVPPGVPAGLSATNDGNRITVSWIGSVEPTSAASAATYTVFRAARDGDFRLVATGLTTPSYTDTDVRGGDTYQYAVSAANAAGVSGRSLVVGVLAGLPDGWRARDVGTVRNPGATTFDGERFTLLDGGADIAGTADGFRFASVPLDGDGVLTARVVFPVSSQYAKLGVMVRGSLDAGSPHAAMLLQGLPLTTWSGVFTTRDTANGPTSASGSTPVSPAQQLAITTNAAYPLSDLGTLPTSATPLAAPYVEGAGDGYRLRMPYWVRLVRKGNRFTGSISPDGAEWTEVGSTELPLGRRVYAGLALSSCLGVTESYAQTGTGAFDNVTVTGAWTTPPPREVVTELAATAGADAIEVAWSTADPAGRFTVLRTPEFGGPPRVVATEVGPVGFGLRVSFLDSTGRPGTGYRYAVVKTNVGGAGPISAEAVATMPTPTVPTITSAGTAFANVGQPFRYLVAATHSPASFGAVGLPGRLTVDPATGLISGVPTDTGTVTIPLTATNAAGSATGNLTLTVGTPPPPGWSAADIGDYVLDDRQLGTHGVVSIYVPGLTSYDSQSGSFTVRGAGTDLNVNGQGLTAQYAYTSVTGDVTITARVSARTNGGTSDQVGLLMLKSLSPFDQMAGVFLASNGSGDAGTKQFIRRLVVAGGTTSTTGSSGVAVPVWLRLQRTDATFTAFSSPDGQTWSEIGQDTIAPFGDATYYVGLAVTSRNPLSLNTTVFDSVTVTA